MHFNAKPLQVEAVLNALNRHNVRCVIIGSFAAILHGVDLSQTDIDLVPKMTDENIKNLAAALIELGIDPEHGTSPAVIEYLRSHPEFISASSIWVVLTSYGEVDLNLKPDGFPNGYDDLVDPAAEPKLGESGITYAGLEDVRRSKEIAGRDKDREALRKFPARPTKEPKVQLPPLPPSNELTLRMRAVGKKGSLVLRPTTDSRSGKTIMRWMKP